MADAPDPGWDFQLSKLEGHDDVALAFGRYMATFAAAEQDLMDFFGSVLGTDFAGAQSLLGEIQSFAMKLKAVEGFAPRATRLKPEGLKAAQVIFEIAKEANSFRNRLVHGIFCTNPKGELLLHPFSLSPTRGKPDPKPINAKMIDDRRELDLTRLSIFAQAFVKNKPWPDGMLTQPSIVQEGKRP